MTLWFIGGLGVAFIVVVVGIEIGDRIAEKEWEKNPRGEWRPARWWHGLKESDFPRTFWLPMYSPKDFSYTTSAVQRCPHIVVKYADGWVPEGDEDDWIKCPLCEEQG